MAHENGRVGGTFSIANWTRVKEEKTTKEFEGQECEKEVVYRLSMGFFLLVDEITLSVLKADEI
jgi:predicted RNA-binding protein (virulence factor B family)